MSAKAVALSFFDALNRRDAAAALGLFAPGASFEVLPASIAGTAENEGRRFLEGLVAAFPDLLVRVRSAMETPDLAVVELKMEGTQAADFLGVLNQEKHLDVDQAWMVRAKDGKIAGVRAYWCQNQLYRRLAVRRLDRISILGARP